MLASSSAHSSILKMEAKYSSETSTCFQTTTRRYNLSCENLTSLCSSLCLELYLPTCHFLSQSNMIGIILFCNTLKLCRINNNNNQQNHPTSTMVFLFPGMYAQKTSVAHIQKIFCWRCSRFVASGEPLRWASPWCSFLSLSQLYVLLLHIFVLSEWTGNSDFDGC
jgi:fucose 4-O-acetylase-like acetyltransferase